MTCWESIGIQLTSQAKPEKGTPSSPGMPVPIHMPGKKSYPLRPPGWRGHSQHSSSQPPTVPVEPSLPTIPSREQMCDDTTLELLDHPICCLSTKVASTDVTGSSVTQLNRLKLLALRMQNGAATKENSLGISPKVKHRTIIRLSNSTLLLEKEW